MVAVVVGGAVLTLIPLNVASTEPAVIVPVKEIAPLVLDGAVALLTVKPFVAPAVMLPFP